MDTRQAKLVLRGKGDPGPLKLGDKHTAKLCALARRQPSQRDEYFGIACTRVLTRRTNAVLDYETIDACLGLTFDDRHMAKIDVTPTLDFVAHPQCVGLNHDDRTSKEAFG
jgi:hypothetical protein